jgi:hypothetical protein
VNKVAQMPARERADLFAETAERKVLPEAIIEKDFWVCWMLKQLFSIDALTGRLLFKGGISLSNCSFRTLCFAIQNTFRRYRKVASISHSGRLVVRG